MIRGGNWPTKTKEKKESKSDSVGSEIQTEHKWSIENKLGMKMLTLDPF